MSNSNIKAFRGIHDFVIYSEEWGAMDDAHDCLNPRMKRMMAGSGTCFMSGERDHHYRCRSRNDAEEIIEHYRKKLKEMRVEDNNA